MYAKQKLACPNPIFAVLDVIDCLLLCSYIFTLKYITKSEVLIQLQAIINQSKLIRMLIFRTQGNQQFILIVFDLGFL